MNGKESSSYAAALYLRLSRDDEGAGDSASIVSQREILTRYARERDFPVYGEYVDDGWSGTNFDRPAFKRMLEDIEAGRVNLVLTKDLSRLGRDYIETGRYTEIYFPSRRVRYIAVNDGYDSENPDSDIAPFRNVINEMYARDTSRKIRSAFAARMQSGAFIGNFAPYGYRKDPADRHHLIPHGQTAPVVQRIFRMAAEGWTPSWIARELSGEGIPPPAVQRLLDRGGEAPFPQREWTAASVARIVRNVVYLGHMAQGKTTRLSFKSGVTVRNPKAEWVVVKDTHAPLVGQEEFERVGRRLSGRTYTGRGEFRNLFSGLARCADCGKGMSTVGTRRREGEADLACGGYKGTEKAPVPTTSSPTSRFTDLCKRAYGKRRASGVRSADGCWRSLRRCSYRRGRARGHGRGMHFGHRRRGWTISLGSSILTGRKAGLTRGVSGDSSPGSRQKGAKSPRGLPGRRDLRPPILPADAVLWNGRTHCWIFRN